MKIERTLNLLDGSPKQIAMMLTHEEWDDLVEICGYYRLSAGGQSGWDEDELRRQVNLCKRIIEEY
jgi:hypothetical protein